MTVDSAKFIKQKGQYTTPEKMLPFSVEIVAVAEERPALVAIYAIMSILVRFP